MTTSTELLERLARLVAALRQGTTITLGKKGDLALTHFAIQHPADGGARELRIKVDVFERNRSTLGRWSLCHWTLDDFFCEMLLCDEEELSAFPPLEEALKDPIAAGVKALGRRSRITIGAYRMILGERADPQPHQPCDAILGFGPDGKMRAFVRDIDFASDIVTL